jgi:hypothetical protein
MGWGYLGFGDRYCCFYDVLRASTYLNIIASHCDRNDEWENDFLMKFPFKKHL